MYPICTLLYFRVCIAKQRHRLSTRPSFTETKNQFDRALGPRSVPVPPAFLLAKLVLRLPHANPVPVAATALAFNLAIAFEVAGASAGTLIAYILPGLLLRSVLRARREKANRWGAVEAPSTRHEELVALLMWSSAVASRK